LITALGEAAHGRRAGEGALDADGVGGGLDGGVEDRDAGDSEQEVEAMRRSSSLRADRSDHRRGW
jgi:hypothetical protein